VLDRPRGCGLGRQLPLGLGSAERGREIDRSIEIPLGGRDIDGVGIVDIELLLLERLVLVFVGLVRVRLWACIHVDGRRTRQPSEPGRALRRLDEVVDLAEQLLERIPTGRPRGRGGGQRAIGAPVEPVDLTEHLPEAVRAPGNARADALAGAVVRLADEAPDGEKHKAVHDAAERAAVAHVLRLANGNQVQAALKLGIHRTTLRKLIDKYGL